MKNNRKLVTILLVVAMVVSTLAGATGKNRSTTAMAAQNGVVKASDIDDEVDSFTTTLSSGESVTISIKNHILTINVDSTSYPFKIGNILMNTTNEAVVNEQDGLLHILTEEKEYYCLDLHTGLAITVRRCNVNGKYCSKDNLYGYKVYGNSLIDNLSFNEQVGSELIVKKQLMTRAEYDYIIDGGDPAMGIPTAKPTATVEPTATIKPAVTAEPTATSAPTAEPTATSAPTAEPIATVTPILEPTPSQTPTVTPSPEPTANATVAPANTIAPAAKQTPAITNAAKPSKPTLTKITVGKKSLKIRWKKVSDCKGYEVWYSTSPKFKSVKKKLVTTNSVTLKKLSNKKYYIKVRACKVINGKKVYGAFSKVKVKKVK